MKTSPAVAFSEQIMTDEQIADMHKLLAEYHRNLAREAVLPVVQQYHADIAQRFADEATQIPRRTAILRRLDQREQHARLELSPENNASRFIGLAL